MQITRSLPLRRTSLQFLQIGLTEARTFIQDMNEERRYCAIYCSEQIINEKIPTTAAISTPGQRGLGYTALVDILKTIEFLTLIPKGNTALGQIVRSHFHLDSIAD
jgi:hypothetical protein